MRSRLVRPAVAASACALLISASVGMSSAAFADDLIPDPLPTITVTVPPIETPVGSTDGTTITVPGSTAAPQPSPTPSGATETPPATVGSGSQTSGAGAASSSGTGSAAASTSTGTAASATSGVAATSATKGRATARSNSAGSTAASGSTPPVLGPSHEGTTLFSDDSSPLGVLAGSSPARTIMSNSVGIAMLGGLGAILLVVIGLRLAVLRRRSQA